MSSLPNSVCVALGAAVAVAGTALVPASATLHSPPRHPAGPRSSSVPAAIDRAAPNERVQLAMLVGAYLESGWRPNAVGDHGHSHGPFQINLPFHPGVSVAEATDPDWAVAYMLGPYTACAAQEPAAAWRLDAKNAAARTARCAEKPARMYLPDRVNAAWSATQTYLNHH